MAIKKQRTKVKMTPKKKKKVSVVLKEFKKGALKSGKKGPKVKSRKQAIAIALSEASKIGKKKKKKVKKKK